MPVQKYNSAEFTIDLIKQLKGNRVLYVVFSTFGEREADLIYEKISLLKKELPEIIDKIFLSHRRFGESQELTEQNALKACSDTEIIICNDYQVPDMSNEKGKGADMRRTLYYINKKEQSSSNNIIIFLDADVVTKYFGSHFVLALAGAVLKGADFAKASFWRAMGRVKKFVAQPLFSAIKNDKLNNLSEFAYPLSGEVAGTIEFFNSVNFWQIYGVETGINIDAVCDDYNIADVNLGKYDHEHSSDLNIQKMSFGIIRTYLLKLIEKGFIELKNGSEVADIFNADYIDEDGERKKYTFDLTEKKYQPLKNIL